MSSQCSLEKKDATFTKTCYFRPHSTNFPHLYSIQGTPYSRMFFDYRRLAIVLVSIHLLTYYLRNAFLQCSVVLILSVLNLCHLQEGLLISLRTSTQPCVPCCSFGHLPVTAYYHVNTQCAFAHFLSSCFPLLVLRLMGLSVLLSLIYFLVFPQTDFLYQCLEYDSLSRFVMHKG